jgi:hypothetical protein
MSREQELKEQLGILKGMFISTGALHEAQKLQLEMWPRLIPGVKGQPQVKLNYEVKSVTFLCESDSLRPTKLQRLICENICTWVRNILWDETKVVIKVNKKSIFDSSKQ